MSAPSAPGANAAATSWNARYARSADAVPAPAEVLSRHERFLPAASAARAHGAFGTPRAMRALDLACGRAGNAERLGALGFEAFAWDVSDVAVAALRARTGSRIAHVRTCDVGADPPAPDTFDVIAVARFLDRAICPAIAAALRPGGVLLYQTFTAGLSNPDFLLGPGELATLFPTLDVLAYREPPPDARGRAEAMLVARRPAAADGP